MERPRPKRAREKGRRASRDDLTVSDLNPEQTVFNRYTLCRVLGRGGMGVVWLARDEELERHVALKFLPEVIVHDRSLLSDLKRETRRSLELTHPNIVRVHDFVQDARSACISMEYVDGDDLTGLRLKKDKRVFETPDLEPLLSQWTEAMDYAHREARVVHCDLKPANLMVTSRGMLKVTDFGIARSLSDSVTKLTMTRRQSGTLVYMSPQQLSGETPSHLDDIYAIGATLYELLTGTPPFYRGRVETQIQDKEPPPLSSRRSELRVESAFIIPRDWEVMIAACLSKDAANRPQTAGEIARAVGIGLPLWPPEQPAEKRGGPSRARQAERQVKARARTLPTNPTSARKPEPRPAGAEIIGRVASRKMLLIAGAVGLVVTAGLLSLLLSNSGTPQTANAPKRPGPPPPTRVTQSPSRNAPTAAAVPSAVVTPLATATATASLPAKNYLENLINMPPTLESASVVAPQTYELRGHLSELRNDAFTLQQQPPLEFGRNSDTLVDPQLAANNDIAVIFKIYAAGSESGGLIRYGLSGIVVEVRNDQITIEREGQRWQVISGPNGTRSLDLNVGKTATVPVKLVAIAISRIGSREQSNIAQSVPTAPTAPSPAANLKLVKFVNEPFKFSVLVPTNIFDSYSAPAGKQRTLFSSRDGRTKLLAYARRKEPQEDLKSLHDTWTKEHTSEDPGKIVDYEVLRDGWFVVSGNNGQRGYYVKVVLRGELFLYMCLEYDENASPLTRDQLSAMSQAFDGR